MHKQLRDMIGNVNFYYKALCSVYTDMYSNCKKKELYCMPEELYIKIFMNSCTAAARKYSEEEIRKGVRQYQKTVNYENGFYDRFISGSPGRYISILETNKREEVMSTGLYLISGFLVLHGENFFKNLPSSGNDFRQLLYFIIFGIKPDEVEKSIACLREMLKIDEKEVEAEQVKKDLEEFLKSFFKHVNEELCIHELRNYKVDVKSSAMEQKIDNIVNEYCKYQGKLPMQNFENREDT